MMVAQLLFTAQSGRIVSYSEFREMVRAGRVSEVVIADDEIRGTEGDGQTAPQRFTVVPVEDPDLLAELEAHGVTVTGEVSSTWLPALFLWLVPILVIVLLWGVAFRQIGRTQGGAMAFGKSRARIYAEDDVKVSFADVAGVDEAEAELHEIIDFLREPGRYTRLGGHIPKGVLLVGPPGTGKTLLARAVAGEARVPFFSLSGSEFVEMFVGVGAARVRDLFTQAERRAPCIVFIDELDALGKLRTIGPAGTHEEREQTLNQLLAEMDGFDSRKGVIILAATNRPEVLDPALLRPGRFDRQVLVDKPDVRGREAILRLHTQRVRLDPGVDLHVVAARTAGFAGADLANLVNEAALLAARHDKDAAGQAEIEEAIERLVAGLEKKRVMTERERRIVAYHEAGHAIVATVLPGLDPVHKISIVQRGFGALGYTLQLPLEERYLMTLPELKSRMAVLLAGRASEEVALGEISTGAQDDLVRATDLARSMVTELGMSERIGVMSVSPRPSGQFVPWATERGQGEVSERTAEQIDVEVREILEHAHDQARQVLSERRDCLDVIATRLLTEEVLEGDDLRALLADAAQSDTTPRIGRAPQRDIRRAN
jgi:cell division protease FtsH